MKKAYGLQFAAGIFIAILALPRLMDLATVVAEPGKFLALWNPMRINTAITLFCLGICVALNALGRRKTTAAMAIFIFSLGTIAMAQFLMGLDLTVADHAGKMPVSVCISFMMLGMALYLRSQAKPRDYGTAASIVFASIPASISTMTILSHFFGSLNSADPGNLMQISLPTALGILIAGVLIASRSTLALKNNKQESFRILPAATTAILATGFIAMWQVQLEREARFQSELIAAETEKVRSEISETLSQTSLALKRYASRVEYLGLKNKGFLDVDAKSYISQLKILKRIGITDSRDIVVWSYPTDISEQVREFDQSSEPLRFEAMKDARQTRLPSLSHAIKLRSGGIGFLLPVALFTNENYAGTLYATVEADKLFHSYINPTDFEITIHEGDSTIMKSNPSGARIYPNLKRELGLKIGLTDWRIEVAPNELFIARTKTALPYYILFFGGLLSALFGAFLQNTLRSKRDAILNEANIKNLNQQLNIALDSARSEARARQASHEWRKAMLDASAYSIISTDAEGIVQTFNAAAEKMLGYKAEDFIGKRTPASLHLPEEIIKRAKQLSEELGIEIEPGFGVFTAKPNRMHSNDENEWTYVRKDGSHFPVSLSATALRDEDGKIFGYLGVAIDLTEKKKALEQIAIATERLQRVIEATGEGIWEREFGEGSKVEFIDSQAKKIFGFPDDASPTYDKVVSFVHPEDRAHIAKILDEHTKNKSSRFEIQFRFIDPAQPGNIRWLHSRGKILERPGRPSRLISTIRDITKEMEAKNQLTQALKTAEEATRAKADFLASMSHEIRTPLNGVIGITDLLLDTPLEQEQKKFADIIQQSGASLLALINNILDFSKIEAGKMELEKLDFSLAQVVEGQADILVSKASEKGLSLMTFIDNNLPPQTVGDAGRIGQILLNLTGNAIKFSQDGGVSIRVTRARGTESATGGTEITVRFEVVDSGIGLNLEAQSKLFQPFVQADAATARKFGGTGLGLSICKKLVEMMGGKIGVISEEGRGSTFWFEIPLGIAKDSPETESHWMLFESPEKIRVLIVDDDANAVDIIHRYIAAWGMRSEQSFNFSMAQGLMKSAANRGDPFNVAIVGQGHAADTGRNLAFDLENSLHGGAPKLILMNDFGERIPLEKAKKIGFEQVISKPVKQSSLFDAISSILSGVRAQKAAETKVTPESDAKKRAAKGLVLVADDVSTNQMVSVRMLENLGYSAHAVGNGKEAIEALRRTPYDLVLMDCQMPEMDGFEATRSIRSSRDPQINNRIPIIALTANAMAGDDKSCLEAGMDDYLSKPVKKEALRIMIERWLDARGKLRSKAA